MSDLEIRQRDPHVLRQGYSAAVRRFEIASIVIYAPTMAWLLSQIIPRIVETNQFRKWAHMDARPKIARLLQRASLILPPDQHSVHHSAPYAKYYCITVGWLNEALFRFGFFQTLEKGSSWITGLIPREDDIGKRAAIVVAQQPLPPLPELPKIVLPSIELPLDLQDVTGRPVAKPD